MLNEESQRILRNGQTIVLALLFSVIAFAAYLFMFGLRANANPIPWLTELAAAAAVILGIISFALPRWIHRGNLARIAVGQYVVARQPMPITDEGRLATSRLAGLVVGCALLEGAAFLNLMCYMTNGSYYSVAIAGVLLVLIAIRFPSAIGWEQRIDDDLRQLAEMRKSGR